MRQACEAGALRFLEARVLRSVPFEDEPPEQQELYAQALHQLLMLFLDAQPGRCALARLLVWTCLTAQLALALAAHREHGWYLQGRGGRARD